MQNISPTRSALLEVKKKIKLAKKGHSLLKKKQDFLINEFFKAVKTYKESNTDILGKTKKVYNSLALDVAYSGIFICKSVSYASKKGFELKHSTKNIMGVKIPQTSLEIVSVENNTYENSPHLGEVRREFKDLLKDLINLASQKRTVKTLAFEIKKIKRRVNSLENIQIPKLESLHEKISFVLAEQ